MAIKMPPSYIDLCRHKQILEPRTFFNLGSIPRGHNPYYHLADTNVPGAPRGSFKLAYALKSWPHLTDNSRYTIFFVTTRGIYIDELSHSPYEEPIYMMRTWARFLGDFGHGSLAINPGKKRTISFLHDVRYEEIIGDRTYPNVWCFFDHECDPGLKEECRHKHVLRIKGENFYGKENEIVTDWHIDLYRALRERRPYLHLRSDNYVKMESIRFWNPSW